jgi:hypothetical protein
MSSLLDSTVLFVVTFLLDVTAVQAKSGILVVIAKIKLTLQEEKN